jgi:hypothetical protein
MRLPRLDGGRKEVAVCTRPPSYAKSGFAYGWTKSERPRNDRGDVGREASVTSVGLNVLEYIDGSGDIDRVGTGEVAEAYEEPAIEPGLTGGGGGIVVSVITVCDTVLERPREKSPAREGREEDVAGEAADTVGCGCACKLGGAIWPSTETLSLLIVDSKLGRDVDVALAEADLLKPLINPSPRVLLLPRFVTKERASSSCSTPSVVVSSVSQGAREWNRIVGPRKLIRESWSSSSGVIDSREALRSRRTSVVEPSRLCVSVEELSIDLIALKAGRAYRGIVKSN